MSNGMNQGEGYVQLVTTGRVRNVTKTPFSLRIPADRDRPGKTINIPPNTEVDLDNQDFGLVETELVRLQQVGILRIISRPMASNVVNQLDVLNHGVLVSGAVNAINFNGAGLNVFLESPGQVRVDEVATLPISHAETHRPATGTDPLETAAPTGELGANTNNTDGSTDRLARSDHTHALATGTASSQAPDQGNAEGTANELARADHRHNIPSAAAVTLTPEMGNTQGAALNFSRSDHTHNLPTDPAVTIGANSTNTEGTASAFSRADHTHDIQTGTPSTLTPEMGNDEGTADELARADHTHDIPSGAAVTIGANSTNTEGTAAAFARTDHTHDLVTGPADTIGANTVNSEGTSNALARADHTHAITTGNVTTQLPEQGNSEGISSAVARADHTHDIPTDVAVTLNANSTNTEGTADAFSRADHTHDLVTGAPVAIGGVGAPQEGTSSALARADHVHTTTPVLSYAGLPASPTHGQEVYVLYGVYDGFYRWDSVRGKWLSSELLTLAWNSNTSNATTNVVLVSQDDNTQQDNDYGVPWATTVVGLVGTQANAITTGNSTQFELATFELSSGTLTQAVASAALTTVGDRGVRSLALNVNIPEMTVVSARRVKLGGSDPVTRPTITVYYRIRLAP